MPTSLGVVWSLRIIMEDVLESANHEDGSIPHSVIPDQGQVNRDDMVVSGDGEETESNGQANEGDLPCDKEVRE